MTTHVSLQGTHPNWGKRIALTLGSVVIAGLIVGLVIFRITKCEDIDEPSVQSPDGKWAAKSTTRACPVSFFSTNYDDIVTLSAAPTMASAKAGPVRIFESDGSSYSPTIIWPTANLLVLKVNGVGTVRVGKHKLSNVTINYVVPKWLWDNLGAIETNRQRQNRESEGLRKAGKLSSDDLRMDAENNQAIAKEWTDFRQWVLENASHEGDLPNDSSGRR